MYNASDSLKALNTRHFYHYVLTFFLFFFFSSYAATPQIQKLMTVLIRQHEALFPPSKDVLPSPPAKKSESKKKNTPRSFVGWESAEVRASSNMTFTMCCAREHVEQHDVTT